MALIRKVPPSVAALLTSFSKYAKPSIPGHRILAVWLTINQALLIVGIAFELSSAKPAGVPFYRLRANDI
ncbi:hypothetical protein [Methylomonas fluvii]|uniref:Uncharacterized protein n=1 Tax=Methylomonas fluvii TaxID=1854564 RepID=A0ABR9DJY5_9GAMM|nr:hypothetical protein [Methylomonas fluvii]MBD9363424.1 hypothetical protein [Methylomonas fluvii]CAD6876707.1 hypothetical protein [Methylomonas fluvii]